MDNSYREAVKFNCDVSDAQYWGYFSICGLLMRYRDLYRSEKGLKPWTNIGREDIAAWIAQKEARWPELEQETFKKLNIDGREYDPFDVSGVNEALKPQGLVYGAGYGMYMKPSFFIAELRSLREASGLTVYTLGREEVRDLLTAPAMLQEKSIFLRLEPLAILLHYKLAELNNKKSSPLEDAFVQYGFRHQQIADDTFEKRLEELAGQYAEILLFHEIAEYRESVPSWKDILAASGDRKNEHFLRAVKDLIADTSDQGPLKRIIDTKDRGALGFSIALMEGFPRVLFPEIRNAYTEFRRSGSWEVIETARRTGYERFIARRNSVLKLHESTPSAQAFAEALKDMLKNMI